MSYKTKQRAIDAVTLIAEFKSPLAAKKIVRRHAGVESISRIYDDEILKKITKDALAELAKCMPARRRVTG